MLFLTNLEVPVVTTAVITIADELGGFDNAGWVLASYLLGYVGKPLPKCTAGPVCTPLTLFYSCDCHLCKI